MVRVMRMAGDEEGKGGKARLMTTRMAGMWTAMATKRAMPMAMRVAGKHGDSNSNKEGNGNGKEGGRQQIGQRQWWQEQG
jgi:hypothetical protein